MAARRKGPEAEVSLGMLRADAVRLTAVLIVLEHVVDPNTDLGDTLDEADLEILARCELAELAVKMGQDLAAGLDWLDGQIVKHGQPEAA